MLYLISLGIYDKKDISVKGLEIARNCDVLYLEGYTNYFSYSLKELSEFIGGEVKELKRKDVENNSDKLLEEAKNKKVGLLVGGDALSATTHISLLLDAKKKNVRFKVIHSSSVFNAIAETGLFLYKFGATVSVPFENKNVKSIMEILKKNLDNGLHTLFLLDLKDKKYMKINGALEYLLNNGIGNLDCICCEALGSDKERFKYGKIKHLVKEKFDSFPQCLIVVGKLHFIEKEALENWK
jgi:diphthine synthase